MIVFIHNFGNVFSIKMVRIWMVVFDNNFTIMNVLNIFFAFMLKRPRENCVSFCLHDFFVNISL